MGQPQPAVLLQDSHLSPAWSQATGLCFYVAGGLPHVAQPWQRGRQLCPGLLPIPVFLEASLPAQHHLLSQEVMVMVGGAMLGTDHRLNLDAVYFLLKGPRVTTF